MNNLGFNPVYRPKDQSRKYKGILIVIALHILIGWGIVSGTAKNALAIIKKPLEAVVIQEVIIPPPPPPLNESTGSAALTYVTRNVAPPPAPPAPPRK